MELPINLGGNRSQELTFPVSTNLNLLTEDQMRSYLDDFKIGDFRRAAISFIKTIWTTNEDA